MPRIAISYRREDAADYAHRIAECLKSRLRDSEILIDFDEVLLGGDFVQAIEDAVGAADVLLAVIGKNWAGGLDAQGQPPFGNDTDNVRLDVETALDRGVRLIPILVGGASMPPVEALPATVAPIVRRQALSIDDARFDAEMGQLVTALERLAPAATRVIESAARDAPEAQATAVMEPTKTSVIKPTTTQVIDAAATRIIVPVAEAATVVLREPGAFDWAKVDLTDLGGDAWVAIPGGRFTMGSNDGAEQERPPHQVTVSDFAMSRFPVTNEQWSQFVESGHVPPEHRKDGQIPDGKGRHPVVQVSWTDATAFCDWLSRQIAGTAPGRIRLPTEAEREFAVRGPGNRKYPWGNEPPSPERANYGGTTGGTTPVDAHPTGATPDRGVYDLAGNVWEWCADWWGDYAKNAVVDPTGPVTGTSRVLRGGSYFDSARYLRASARPGSGPNARLGFYGFRIVYSESDQGATRVIGVKR